MANLPFDINGYKKFIMDNFLKSNQPKAKIGLGTPRLTTSAEPIKMIAQNIGKSKSPIDDALNILYGKGKSFAGASLGEELGTVASKLAPMASNVGFATLAVPSILHGLDWAYGDASRNAYEDAKKKLALLDANKPSALKQVVQPKLKKANIAPNNIQQALPALPKIQPMSAPDGTYSPLPSGSIPAGQTVYDNQGNGIVTGNATEVPKNWWEKISEYQQPESQVDTALANKRIGEIVNYLSKYSPEQYATEIKNSDLSKQRNRGYDAVFGTDGLFSSNPTDLDRQAKVLEYLKAGYDTNMDMANTARKLSEAEAMGRATGTPSSWWEDSKDVLANIAKPQITAQGQKDLARIYGQNQLAVAGVNNTTKQAIANLVSETANARTQSEKQIAMQKLLGILAGSALEAKTYGDMEDEDVLNTINALIKGGLPEFTKFTPEE
jgi:hypothetical protein